MQVEREDSGKTPDVCCVCARYHGKRAYWTWPKVPAVEYVTVDGWRYGLCAAHIKEGRRLKLAERLERMALELNPWGSHTLVCDGEACDCFASGLEEGRDNR